MSTNDAEPLTPEEEARVRLDASRGTYYEFTAKTAIKRLLATLDAARAAQDVAGRDVDPWPDLDGQRGQPVTPPPDALREALKAVPTVHALTSRTGRYNDAWWDRFVRELADAGFALSVPAPTLPALDAETLARAMDRADPDISGGDHEAEDHADHLAYAHDIIRALEALRDAV